MFHHAWLALLSGAAAIGLLASAAVAAPLGPRPTPPEAEALVEKVHGCHRRCRWGPRRGWHRHVGRFCRPVRWGCRRMWFRPSRGLARHGTPVATPAFILLNEHGNLVGLK
jgi:hypothetical protein